MAEAIGDPLATARAVAVLDAILEKRGYTASLDTDFAAFSSLRRKLRGGEPEGALFDIQASAISSKKGFWMSLCDKAGRVVALQAFRSDYAEPSLADWALGWILGVYLKRSELIVPERIEPPPDSVARKLSGTVVYHGELWFDPEVRGQHLMEPFTRMGLILSHIRWRPKAVWALTNSKMAFYANVMRCGYAYQERAFLRWQMAPEGAEPMEWLSIADRPALERLVSELALKRPEYRRG